MNSGRGYATSGLVEAVLVVQYDTSCVQVSGSSSWEVGVANESVSFGAAPPPHMRQTGLWDMRTKVHNASVLNKGGEMNKTAIG